MRLAIKKEVFQKFHPQFSVAFILAEKVDNNSKLRESQHLLREIEQINRLLFCQDLPQNHYLISPWKVAQQEFGKKAHHYQTSVEQLLKKVLNKNGVQSPFVLLNLINYLSLKHLVPIAIDDYDKIKREITFGLSTGKEKVGLFRKLKKNVLYYYDQQGILGTKLDYWKPTRTRIDKKTKRFLIHIDCLPPVTEQKLKEIVQETGQLIKEFSESKVRAVILSKKRSSQKWLI